MAIPQRNHKQMRNHYALLLTTPKGTTVLREEVIDRYLELKREVEAVEVMEGAKTSKYSTLCREPAPVCQGDVVSAIMSKGLSVDLTYPETYLPATAAENVTKLYLGTTFGGVETDPDGAIARARALALYFRIKPTTEKMVLGKWDEAFRGVVGNATVVGGEGENGVRVGGWSRGSFVEAVGWTLGRVWAYLGYSALLVVLLSGLGGLRQSSYRSKPLLGLALGVGVVLSGVAGTSVRLGASGELSGLAFPALFALLPGALLLLFSLAQSWAKFSNAAIHPREKLMFLLGWDGPLVVGTAVAAVLAFAVTGASSSLPYFRDLALTLSASISVLAVLALSAAASALYLAGRREAAGLKWFHFWRQGDTHFPLPLTKDYDEKNIQRLHSKLIDEQPSPSRSIGSALSKGKAAPILFGLTRTSPRN